MNQDDAKREIIREWRALPKEQRQTDEQAALFAMQIKDKYKFRGEFQRRKCGSVSDDLGPVAAASFPYTRFGLTMPRLVFSSGKAGCGATIELDNGDTCLISVAQAGVLVRSYKKGIFERHTRLFFRPDIVQ
jgi:hypothetical protein